jgi:hypothetical protein
MLTREAQVNLKYKRLDAAKESKVQEMEREAKAREVGRY